MSLFPFLLCTLFDYLQQILVRVKLCITGFSRVDQNCAAYSEAMWNMEKQLTMLRETPLPCIKDVDLFFTNTSLSHFFTKAQGCSGFEIAFENLAT